MSDKLYVVSAFFNFTQSPTRSKLANDFTRYMEQNKAVAYFPLALYPGRSIATINNSLTIGGIDMVASKENLLNVAMSRLPPEAKYVAWLDTDIIFARPDWAEATLEALQNYDVVQMFSHGMDLDKDGAPGGYILPGAMYKYALRNKMVSEGCTGFAWAARREALRSVGGLGEWNIFTAGDSHFVEALLGRHPTYLHTKPASIMQDPWPEWATKVATLTSGYVSGLVRHRYHGPRSRRGYQAQWDIIKKHNFSARTHLKKNLMGVWEFSEGASPEFRYDVEKFYTLRGEDE